MDAMYDGSSTGAAPPKCLWETDTAVTMPGTTKVIAKKSPTVIMTRSGTATGLHAMTSESENIAMA